MFGFLKGLVGGNSDYHKEYAVTRFKAWWDNHGHKQFNGYKQVALLQWATEPVRGMPDWNDDACEELKQNWMNE